MVWRCSSSPQPQYLFTFSHTRTHTRSHTHIHTRVYFLKYNDFFQLSINSSRPAIDYWSVITQLKEARWEGTRRGQFQSPVGDSSCRVVVSISWRCRRTERTRTRTSAGGSWNAQDGSEILHALRERSRDDEVLRANQRVSHYAEAHYVPVLVQSHRHICK